VGAAAAIGAAAIATAAAPAVNSGAIQFSLILTVLLLRSISNVSNSRIAAQRRRAIGANTHKRACQQESMPACQQPARHVAPVAAGDQLELAEVGRDRHESERVLTVASSPVNFGSRSVLMAVADGCGVGCPLRRLAEL
jgi:hypothetical protein